MSSRKAYIADVRRISSCAESFSESCATPVRAYDGDGRRCCSYEPVVLSCTFCKSLSEKYDIPPPDCSAEHERALQTAERLGGRYIYSCSRGLVHFASPITLSDKSKGVLIGGPLLLTEVNDYIAYELGGSRLPSSITAEFDEIVVETPERVSHLSYLLFMAAGYISGFEKYGIFEGQSIFESDFFKAGANGGDAEQLPEYPMPKETELVGAIKAGDKSAASQLLNELLGHIFFLSGTNMATIRVRVIELIVIISRAAVEGGADAARIFELNNRYLSEINRFSNLEELSFFLTDIMTRFIGIVFKYPGVKHIDVITKATNYINANYMRKIALTDVAKMVFLSDSYFSRIFKDEIKESFSNYLSRIRVEKSMALLLSGDMSLLDICSAVGFEDQSYYCKVFRKYTGVTPGKYRESRGKTRLLPDMERGK